MRSLRALLAPAVALLLGGCGYIHFGRYPDSARIIRESKFAESYTSLTTEHKILKQELALARREGDALRIALERATAGTNAAGLGDIVSRLNETARELAALRAEYARLQAERASKPAAPASSAQLRELEEKLAASLRDHTQLKGENARLRGEIDRARAENASLTERLKVATAQYDRAQLELSQLNTELVAQKQARGRAEQATDALRAQLGTVLAQPPATSLQLAKAPPAEASPTAELRTNGDRLRTAPPPSPERGNDPSPAQPARKHVVQAGDTLEKLSQRYYGAPDRWRAIYDANTALLGTGQPLRPGMELTVPEQ